MAAHPIFDIPELLLAIFEHLQSRPDQLRFMLLCRSTWQIAAQEMWKTIYDPWQFMNLIPDDVQLAGSGSKLWQTLEDITLTRPLTDAEWGRVRLYCQHIRSLRLTETLIWAEDDYKPTLLSRAFLILSTSRADLFTSLTDISLEFTSWSAYLACEFLLSRPLQVVALSIGTRTHHNTASALLDRLLEVLVKNSGDLKELKLEHEDPNSAADFRKAWEEQLVTLLAKLGDNAPNLKTVDFSRLWTGELLLPALANLRGLQTATLTWGRMESSPGFVFPENSFKNLKAINFDLEWCNDFDPRSLFESISSDEVERISILGDIPVQDINTINPSRRSETLREFRLEWTSSGADINSTWDAIMASFEPLPAKYLPPLLQCRRLRRLCMALQYPWDLTDERVDDIVHTLPELRSLDLSSNFRWSAADFIPRATIRSLRAIADGLPNLKYLTLDVHLADPSVTDETIKKAANPRIRRFRSYAMGGGSIDKVRERARVLFPGMAKIQLDEVNGTVIGVEATARGYRLEEDIW